MTHTEIRRKFIDFFRERGHTPVPSSSLLPTDPSVLFTTAGMQQFKPYYTGAADAQKDFGSLNTVSIQRCIRTSDIDEVGDESHLTFFEMLGNFSFGGYGKREAIQYAYDFITREMRLKIDHVSVFGGEQATMMGSSAGFLQGDIESENIWKSIDPDIRIKRSGSADNFWGPTGDEGPCGPTTEIYVDGIEVWNIVFNQYYCHQDKRMMLLEKPGIDTGMGLERLAKVVQGVQTVFDTDLLAPILKLTPAEMDRRTRRIVTDHARAIAFLVSDGVTASNKEQGYVLRRLMRRVIAYNFLAKSDLTLMHDIFAKIVELYQTYYSHLNASLIINAFDHEKEKFEKTLNNGLKELRHIDEIDASTAFRLYESYGLPYEVIKELSGAKAAQLTRQDFEAKFKEHQQKSRAGAEKKFGGHGLLLDTGELKAANEEELKKVTRLHTATHLLQAALRKVLGDSVHQAGSDITAERTRFDFTFDRKLTSKEIKNVEELVNDAIRLDLPVTKQTLPQEEALKTGALHFFKTKYPPCVDVYTIGNPSADSTGSPRASSGPAFSREFCGGPHVTHTSEIGKFKIIKEEAVSAGVRRIRAAIQ